MTARRGIGGSGDRKDSAHWILVLAFSIPLLFGCSIPRLSAQNSTTAEIQSGQELIYRGRFGAAQIYFAALAQERPRDPAGPTLEASALIWWAEARGDDSFQADSIDLLLAEGIARAQTAVDSATDDAARVTALYWLGTAYAYHGRQAEARGGTWRAVRDARAMLSALERAVALDSTCVDCLLGLGAYDYALARTSALLRLVARIVGLGGGDFERGVERIRRVSESGILNRIEARWLYANVLLREGERDQASREQGLKMVGELALQFPDNPIFRKAAGLPTPSGSP